jgi:hypothetical protein
LPVEELFVELLVHCDQFSEQRAIFGPRARLPAAANPLWRGELVYWKRENYILRRSPPLEPRSRLHERHDGGEHGIRRVGVRPMYSQDAPGSYANHYGAVFVRFNAPHPAEAQRRQPLHQERVVKQLRL